MNSVVVERNVPTDIPAIWLLRTFWSEESIRKLDCYCHWLGGTDIDNIFLGEEVFVQNAEKRERWTFRKIMLIG